MKKRKMVLTFGAQYETGRAEGEFLGRGAGKKYRVKRTNLSGELLCEYGANHLPFLSDPSKERPPKVQKFMIPKDYLSTPKDLP